MKILVELDIPASSEHEARNRVYELITQGTRVISSWLNPPCVSYRVLSEDFPSLALAALRAGQAYQDAVNESVLKLERGEPDSGEDVVALGNEWARLCKRAMDVADGTVTTDYVDTHHGIYRLQDPRIYARSALIVHSEKGLFYVNHHVVIRITGSKHCSSKGLLWRGNEDELKYLLKPEQLEKVGY